MITDEEIRNMSEEEVWEYVNRPKPHPMNEGEKPLHFNTKEEWRKYYSGGHEINEFIKIMREKYGI